MALVAADGVAFGVGNLRLPDIMLSILGGEVNDRYGAASLSVSSSRSLP